jgi:hypothetical protein
MLCPECGAANVEGSRYCARCGRPLAGVGPGPVDDVGAVVVFARALKWAGVLAVLVGAFPLLAGLLKTCRALGGAAPSERTTMLRIGIGEAFGAGLPWLAGGIVFCICIFILSRSLVRGARRRRRSLL